MIDVAALPEIPEGALRGETIIISSFTQLDGTQGFVYRCGGDALTGTYIGLLEMVQHSLMHQNYEHDAAEE